MNPLKRLAGLAKNYLHRVQIPSQSKFARFCPLKGVQHMHRLICYRELFYDSSSLRGSQQTLEAPQSTSSLRVSLLCPETHRLGLNDEENGKDKSKKTKINWELPPLSSLEEIFGDIVEKGLKNGLDDLIKRLNSQPIRVATVCSGTESPLLAIEMIQKRKIVKKDDIYPWLRS